MTSMALYIILCYSSWLMNILLKYLNGRIRKKKPQNRKSTGLKIHQMSYIEYLVSCVLLKTFCIIEIYHQLGMYIKSPLGFINGHQTNNQKKEEKLKTIRSQSPFCLKYLNTNYKNEIRVVFWRNKISYIFNSKIQKEKLMKICKNKLYKICNLMQRIISKNISHLLLT